MNVIPKTSVPKVGVTPNRSHPNKGEIATLLKNIDELMEIRPLSRPQGATAAYEINFTRFTEAKKQCFKQAKALKTLIDAHNQTKPKSNSERSLRLNKIRHAFRALKRRYQLAIISKNNLNSLLTLNPPVRKGDPLPSGPRPNIYRYKTPQASQSAKRFQLLVKKRAFLLSLPTDKNHLNTNKQ